MQLEPGIRTQENVEERIQEGVKAGKTVAQAVDEENWALKCTGLISQEQGHKSVSAHKVVGSEHNNEIDCDDDQDAHDFAPFMVGEGWSSECHSDVGWGVAEGGGGKQTD